MTPTPSFQMATDLDEARRLIAAMLPASAEGAQVNFVPSRTEPDCWLVLRAGSLDHLGSVTAREDGCRLIVLEQPAAP